MSDPSAPVVVVAPPGSGTALLAAALDASPQLRRLPAQLLDALPGVPAEHHRLTADDATPERTAALVAALRGRLSTAAPIRPLLSGPRLALRVGFLAAALPGARFVVLDADPARALARATDAWPGGAPVLPGAPRDAPAAWREIRATLESDLAAIDPARVSRVDRRELLSRPEQVLRALAGFAGIEDDPTMAAVVVARAGDDAPRVNEPPAATGRHTPTFAGALRRAGGAVLAAVPDPGLLVLVQLEDGAVRAATVPLPRVRGVAADGERVAISAQDLRLLTRTDGGSTFTASSRVDADGMTLGDPVLTAGAAGAVVDHPVPGIAAAQDGRLQVGWRPPGRRRRVGGVAVDEGVAAFATTHGGIVVDLRADAVVAAGLDLPCAPCCAGGRLWLVERGTGALSVLDPATGAVERVARVDGVAHGLAAAGGMAFVCGLRRGTGAIWAFDLATGAAWGVATLGTGVGTATSVAVTRGVPRPHLVLSRAAPPPSA